MSDPRAHLRLGFNSLHALTARQADDWRTKWNESFEEPSVEARRVVIVFDGQAWYVRHLAVIEHNLTRDEKVYHCDAHFGGPFTDIDEAVTFLKTKI
jgi:hypothetical protein